MHAMLVAIMLWLSIDMQLPGDILAGSTWTGFSGLATQQQWSYMFLVAAVAGLTGLVSPIRLVQRLSILALSSAHTTVAWLFFRADTPAYGIPPGGGLYTIIATAGFWLCVVRFLECEC